MRVEECAVLIRITRVNPDDLSSHELYEQTRGTWRISPTRAAKAEYAFCVHKGVVKEVYTISGWDPECTTPYPTRRITKTGARWEFRGSRASDAIRQKYVDQSVAEYFRQGNTNPIKYTC